jgi:hypothetical protein
MVTGAGWGIVRPAQSTGTSRSGVCVLLWLTGAVSWGPEARRLLKGFLVGRGVFHAAGR